MLSGNYELAWRESDLISVRGNPDHHRFWDGQPLTGRHVLIRCLHGLGDTIQFIRYAPLIRQQARSLTIEAQPTLKLLLSVDLADDVITWGEPEPYWNQQIEIVELPRIFRTTIKTIPRDVPYLKIPPEAGTHCDGFVNLGSSNHPASRLRIGIVWASGAYNPARSMRLSDMAGLFSTPNVSFFSLQGSPDRSQLEPWSSDIPSLYHESGCVLRMAQNLAAMDLVVTVDTMIAHLAGAMGRPVWTLLPFEADWRWMLERDDSPWYPTMRLFRQSHAGDWKNVIAQVQRALNQLVITPLQVSSHPVVSASSPDSLTPTVPEE